MCHPCRGFLIILDPFSPPLSSLEYLKSGNANLQIGGLYGAIQENGVPGLTTMELQTILKRTRTWKEERSLAYVIAIMNMMLRGGLPCDVALGLPATEN
jgi:hypothetical protein